MEETKPVYSDAFATEPSGWSRIRAMFVTVFGVAAVCLSHKYAGGVTWPLMAAVTLIVLAYTARGTLDRALSDGVLGRIKESVLTKLPK